jgi:hypothetical protein
MIKAKVIHPPKKSLERSTTQKDILPSVDQKDHRKRILANVLQNAEKMTHQTLTLMRTVILILKLLIPTTALIRKMSLLMTHQILNLMVMYHLVKKVTRRDHRLLVVRTKRSLRMVRDLTKDLKMTVLILTLMPILKTMKTQRTLMLL